MQMADKRVVWMDMPTAGEMGTQTVVEMEVCLACSLEIGKVEHLEQRLVPLKEMMKAA
jgi:hypothetical protein